VCCYPTGSLIPDFTLTLVPYTLNKPVSSIHPWSREFGPKKKAAENYITRNDAIYTFSQILAWPHHGGWDGSDM